MYNGERTLATWIWTSLFYYVYNYVTSVCIFIGCWPWSIKDDAHRWRQFHVSRFVFLFSWPKNPSINHLNVYWIKQIDNIFSVSVYCNRPQKTSQREKNNSHATLLVSHFFVLYTLWRHLWSIIVHKHGKM